MIRVLIPGKYWDSHLGFHPAIVPDLALILVRVDGAIMYASWDQIVSTLAVPHELNALKEALLGSFLPSRLPQFLVEPFTSQIVAQTAQVTNHLDGTEVDLGLFTTYDNPFPFPYTDAFFAHDIAVVNSSGLYIKPFTKSSVEKISDLPGLCLSGRSVKHLCIAAGSEGLWVTPREMRLDLLGSSPVQISKRNCNTVVGGGATNLIAASLNGGRMFLVDPREPQGMESQSPHVEKTVFLDGFQWASGGKSFQSLALYSYNEGSVRSVWQTSEQGFTDLGTRVVGTLPDTIVSVQAGEFGSVFDMGDHVTVLLNDGTLKTFPGEAVVRVYGDQLHLIRDDHIEILMFPRLVPSTIEGFGTKAYPSATVRDVLKFPTHPGFTISP